MQTNLALINLEDIKLNANSSYYTTIAIANHIFAIDVKYVRDVFFADKLTNIPLVPGEIHGALNLRGRVLVALNMRKILNLESHSLPSKIMSVVIEYKEELYSFVVDNVCEVIEFSANNIIDTKENIPENWHNITTGIFPDKNKLITILDIEGIINNLINSVAKT